MAKSRKKKGSPTPKSKPSFACGCYPHCPDRERSVRRVVEQGDDDEGFPDMVTFDWFPVTGPCRSRCYQQEMDTPVGHTVIAIIGGRAVDIGS